jgi:hypothetical protein
LHKNSLEASKLIFGDCRLLFLVTDFDVHYDDRHFSELAAATRFDCT